MTTIESIDIQEKELSRLLEWIRHADSKAQIVMGLALSMIGAAMAVSPAPENLNWFAIMLISVGVAGPAYCLYECCRASQPDVVGPIDSLIFFGRIKNLREQEYIESVMSRTPEEYLKDLNQQCHVNAVIAEKKYSRIKRAWIWIFRSILPWAGSVYWLYRGL